ncbi:MAG: hypothetical protein RL410_130 [Actinomycetota bacterium]
MVSAILVALLGAALLTPQSQAAAPVEFTLTGSSKINGGPFAATNGTASVVAWVEETGDDSSRIMVSTKIGSAAWSKGFNLGQVEWSKWTKAVPVVTASGRIFIVWVDDEDIRYREKVGTAGWSSEQVLPGSAFDGSWSMQIDAVATGEALTVSAAHSMVTNLSVMSWTRTDANASFVSDVVAQVPSSNELGTCTLGTVQDCLYRVDNLKIASNDSGNQVIAFQTHRDTANYKMNGSKWSVQVATRSAINADWSAPQIIDRMAPTSKDENGYAYFLDTVLVTPNGKSAVAWYRGIDSAGWEGRVAVKAPDASTFTLQDKTAFQSGYATMDPLLGNSGNTIFVTYKYLAKSSSDYVSKIGTVGNLSGTAKTFSLDGNWDIQAFIMKDGVFSVLLAPDYDSKTVGAYSSSRKSDGTWTAPVKRSLTMPAFYLGRFSTFDIAFSGTEQLLTFSKQKGTCPNCDAVGVYVTNFA